MEFLASGSAITWSEVKIFRLSGLVGPMAVLVLLAQLIFFVLTLYFFVKFCRKIKKEKIKYFQVKSAKNSQKSLTITYCFLGFLERSRIRSPCVITCDNNNVFPEICG